MTTAMRPLLTVRDLKVHFKVGSGWVRAVDGVDLDLHSGQTLGLVGESGSGKTTLGYSLLGLLPPNASIVDGGVQIGDVSMTAGTPEAIRSVRWKRVAMVFQGAMAALNPVFSVGDQIVRATRHHLPVSKPAARTRAAELFERVGLSPSRLNAYPHELSGGQRQRVMIALALACEPEVLIADEPTTALDVVAQGQVLDLLRELHAELGLSVILISHDLGAVANLCQTIAVLYAGRIVELGPRERVLSAPDHPYTRALLNAYPRLDERPDALATISGSPPDLRRVPPGCSFHPRCPFATDLCRTDEPPLIASPAGGWARCHYAGSTALDALPGIPVVKAADA